MSYQTPNQAPTASNKPLVAAVTALGVVMMVTLIALAAVFFVGGTSDAANAAPALAAAEPTQPIQKQIPADAAEANQPAGAVQADASPAEAAPVQAEAAPTQAAPAQDSPAAAAPAPAAQADAAPAQAAPVQAAPVPFRPTCGTSKGDVMVGETFIISGTHVPANISVDWSFDHGDGFVDHRNPSHAYYEYPGTYTVTGLAEVNGDFVQRVHCGTVTATAPQVEFHCTIDDTYIPVNGQTVFRATSNTNDNNVVYTFDHGDGYSEVANPSYATYYQTGTYYVSVTAFYNGVVTHVDCGTVTVFDATPPTCPTQSVIGMTEAAANAAILAANCTPITVARGLEIFPITADYRTDRVQLVVGLTGLVMMANIG